MKHITHLIPFGTITKTHGVHGSFVINANWFDEPQNYIAYILIKINDEFQPFPLELKGTLNGNCVIVKNEKCLTIENAKTLIGTELFISRDSLPQLNEDEYFPCDIISLNVRDENDNNIGIVTDVVDFGSGATIEVQLHGEKENLEYYLIDDYTKIDFEKRIVSIVLPKYV